ncbi:MAG: LysM peptidoglycan-binding domain-containing protein, partial [Sphaerochaetaceae bacterium]
MDKRSLKVIVLVVILGILLCAAVVLIWVIYFSGDEAAPPKPVEPQVVASEVPLEEPPKGEVVIKTPTPAPIVTPQTQSGWYQEYIVQEGDTLESIIEEFTISRETILSVNPIKSIQEIKPGFTLKVPSRNGQLYTVQPGDSLSIITNRFNPTLGWKTLQE